MEKSDQSDLKCGNKKPHGKKMSEQFPAEGWHIWHGECTALEDKGVVNAQLNVNCLLFLKTSHIFGSRWEPPKKCQRVVIMTFV